MEWTTALPNFRAKVALAVIAYLLSHASALADDFQVLSGLQRGEPVAVVEIGNDGTVITADGNRLHLADVFVSTAPFGPTASFQDERRSADPSPRVAETALAELLTGRYVQPLTVDATPDRYGRLSVHLLLLDHAMQPIGWVQAELLARGIAVVMANPLASTALRSAMLAVEDRARSAKVGLWSRAGTAVLSADDPAGIQPGFRLVEGRVAAIGESRHSLFLNFGPDWRQDFTVIIQRSDRAAFDGGLKGLRALAGQRVRVRGRVFDRGGPSIRAMHQNTIEIVETEIVETQE